jgi:hypothetical protein
LLSERAIQTLDGLDGSQLATAQALHYYAVFAVVPFFIAEAVLVLQARRLRVVVWLALACGPVPLLVFWPLLSKFKAYYGAHIWAKAEKAA